MQKPAFEPRRKRRSHLHVESLEGRVVMSTFRVNTTLDTVAVDLRTGKDASGHISLRSAIMAANASGGSNTIKLAKGMYKLTIAGANEDASATGDLDIKSNVNIKGSGSRATVIDGENLDRVFDIFQGVTKISGVTIEHGLADSGGGLRNLGGQVSLTSVAVIANQAVGGHGAKESLGPATAAVQTGMPGAPGSDGGAAVGGAIFNQAGSLVVANSTIAGNQAMGSDGGRGHNAGAVQGASKEAVDGQSVKGGIGGQGGAGGAAFGGGIDNAKGASLSLSGTLLVSNVAIGGRGGEGGTGGDGTGGAAGAPRRAIPRPVETAAEASAATEALVGRPLAADYSTAEQSRSKNPPPRLARISRAEASAARAVPVATASAQPGVTHQQARKTRVAPAATALAEGRAMAVPAAMSQAVRFSTTQALYSQVTRAS